MQLLKFFLVLVPAILFLVTVFVISANTHLAYSFNPFFLWCQQVQWVFLSLTETKIKDTAGDPEVGIIQIYFYLFPLPSYELWTDFLHT